MSPGPPTGVSLPLPSQAEDRLVTAVRQTLTSIGPYCRALGLGDVAAPYIPALGYMEAAGLLTNACRTARGGDS